MPIGLPAALALGSIGSGVATVLLNRNRTQTVRTELTPQGASGARSTDGPPMHFASTGDEFTLSHHKVRPPRSMRIRPKRNLSHSLPTCAR